jgi:hypothetical protein
MGMSAMAAENQASRRREVATKYIARVSKAQIARDLHVNPQTINRDVKWLEEKWNAELIKDPVAARARTLATMQQLERDAAKKYQDTGEGSWWDRWLVAVQAITHFLGLDSPIKVDAHLDGDLHFTFSFETPDGRVIEAADWIVMEGEYDETV